MPDGRRITILGFLLVAFGAVWSIALRQYFTQPHTLSFPLRPPAVPGPLEWGLACMIALALVSGPTAIWYVTAPRGKSVPRGIAVTFALVIVMMAFLVYLVLQAAIALRRTASERHLLELQLIMEMWWTAIVAAAIILLCIYGMWIMLRQTGARDGLAASSPLPLAMVARLFGAGTCAGCLLLLWWNPAAISIWIYLSWHLEWVYQWVEAGLAICGLVLLLVPIGRLGTIAAALVALTLTAYAGAEIYSIVSASLQFEPGLSVSPHTILMFLWVAPGVVAFILAAEIAARSSDPVQLQGGIVRDMGSEAGHSPRVAPSQRA